MADSNRLAALKQMTTFLRNEIRPGNGYQHDLLNSIFRGRLLFGNNEPLPMVSILEGMDPDRGPDSVGFYQNLQSDHWVLLFQGWTDDDLENPTDPAHNLMASVKQALGKLNAMLRDIKFDGTPLQNFASMVVEPGVVRPPDNLSNKAYFWMRVIVKIVDDVSAPFWSPP